MTVFSRLFIILICSMFASFLYGQTQEINSIAKKQVRDLDEKIILVNPSASLSIEQTNLVFELFVDKIIETRKITNSNSSTKEKEVKDHMSRVMKKLHFEILTKKQREAKFEYQKLYQSK